MTRYTINEMPFPLHDKNGSARTHWAVTDNKPQCEAFHTATGVELMEENAPPFRHVSYHAKRGHAQMVADALNAAIFDDDKATRALNRLADQSYDDGYQQGYKEGRRNVG